MFSKIGGRNAMVIAVASFALDLDPSGRGRRRPSASAGPTALRAPEAEAFLAGALDWRPATVDEPAAPRFGELCAAAAARSTTCAAPPPTAATRVGVLARRAAQLAMDELRRRDA